MRPSVPRRLACALLVLALVVGAAEGVLRLLLPPIRRASLPNETIRAHLEGGAFRFDADLGWYWADPGGPGSPVNAYGFVRSTPMTREKPPGVTRVLTFGDSQTFGAGKRPSETWSARAEARLGPGWEALNAGVSGCRSFNVYRLLRLKMLAYEPDAIVVDCLPFDRPRDDGSLEGSPEGAGWRDWLRARLWDSRVYWGMRMLVEKANPQRGRWLDQATPVVPADPARRALLGNHDLIAARGAESGVAVLFMEYPVMDEGGVLGCKTQPGELPSGSPVVPACQRLHASGRPGPALFQDRNHLTVEGNAIVGQAVAETLRAWRAAGG